MKMVKRCMAMLLLVILMVCNVMPVSAADYQTEAVYDLEKGGTQAFVIRNEEGELVEVVIEELPGNARIANGNYKVRYKNTGAWEAGFYVEISSNQISRAYSPFYTAVAGSISLPSLVRNSTTKATFSFIYKMGLVNYSTGVVATMSGTELTVKQKS